MAVPSVDRSPLLRRVASSNARIVVLSAPAGYGKSHFRRMLAATRSPVGTADVTDMLDMASAVRALLRGLGPFESRFEQRVARHLVALPTDGSADARWADLLVEALLRPDGAVMTCIENAELLLERPAAAAVVSRTIGTLHRSLVICTRSPLTLNALLRTPPNERYDITVDDLRFTDDEVTALFDPCGTSMALISRVIAVADGWPIAVLTFLRAAREDRLEVALRAADSGAFDDLIEYTLHEALGSLTPPARGVLGAAALVGRISRDEIGDMTCDAAPGILSEIEHCPFVERVGTGFEVHPLAAAAVLKLGEGPRELVCLAAARAADPVRAAELYIRAGEVERAADILDGALAPYMLGPPRSDVARIVASIDEAVLVRHPATHAALLTARGYSVPLARSLSESRAAWRALPEDAPLELRLGIGMMVLNWTVLTNRVAEAEAIFGALRGAVAELPYDAPPRVVLDGWKYFLALRQGRSLAWADVSARLLPFFSSVDSIHAQFCFCLDGPMAFLQGNRRRARDRFEAGVQFGTQDHPDAVQITATINAAFFAWLAGEEELFQRYLAMLDAASAPNVANGARYFLACARGDDTSAPTGCELPYAVVYAELIAAARARDRTEISARCIAAVEATAADGQPWLAALAWAALGLVEPGRRRESFKKALHIAADVEYDAFRASIATLAKRSVPPEWAGLGRLSETPPVPVFFQPEAGHVTVDGVSVRMSPRETEVLLALALHPSGRDGATLAATIWPDLPSSAGAKNVKVYVNRLRRKLGDGLPLVSSQSGYAPRRAVDLSLFALEHAGRNALASALPETLERVVQTPGYRLPQWLLTSEWLAPYARRYEEALRAVRHRRARDTEKRGDLDEARRYDTMLAADDGA